MGVLAIMAVMATAGATTAMTVLRQKQRTTETANLETIANSLTASVRRTRSLPGTATWIDAVATEMADAPIAIGTNRVGNRRILVVDPTATIGPVGGASGLPYTQTSVGATPPSNLRMVLLSSVGPELPDLSTVSFANLWNAPADQLPTGWPANWSGEPAELSVQRMDLGSLFRRVVLNNLTTTNAATYTLGTSTNRVTLAGGARQEFWVIDTSEISLFDSDSTLSIREVIRKDASYVLEDGQWRNRLLVGAPSLAASCGPFADLVDEFLAAPLSPSSSKANKQSVVNAAFMFMHSWTYWSREGSCDKSGYWFTTEKEIADASANLDNSAKRLE